ncbi:phage major capsid protein [Paraconexibacter algicola]|uniref:Phage major capsid protein n=1 Tax=Paraconexibacter algicola TaxID=2133960 RepID=A0A2T4UE51_9ACTN|nr:phage major capsid protein [Paraconexibacter algicola]PTL55745.1 phage major capsid protein [Paraconexibacter algicola]
MSDLQGELKKLADDLHSTFESEFKGRMEQAEQEAKKHGEEFAETKAAVDRVQDRLDEIEVKFQQATLAPAARAGEAPQEVKDFLGFVRSGKLPEETKVMALRDESLGGVLAPAEYIAEVIKGIVQYSPIRNVARVRQTSRTSVQAPKRTGNFAAQWVDEIATRTETTGRTYGLEEIPTHELYARVIVSNWDLEDPVVNLEADLNDAMSEQFGVAEGSAFVTGNGVKKPEGFLTNADIELVPNGGASFASADKLIDLQFALKEQYWQNASWALNRLSLRDIRKLKDTTNNYIWAPGLGPGAGITGQIPATILGSPYTICPDMPTAASNAKTVTYGDFQKAYWIVDRIEMSMLRDPFSAAGNGQVILHARKRVGGQVVLSEALKTLQMA